MLILLIQYSVLLWTEHLIMSQMLTIIQNTEMVYYEELANQKEQLNSGQDLLRLPEPVETFEVSEVQDDGLVDMLAEELQEDTLSIDDIHLDEEDATPSYEASHELSRVKIAEEKQGLQIWQGRIVGLEYEYIHFYDGTRTWLHVGDLSHFEKDDVIEVLVDQQDDHVEVIHVRDVFRVQDEYKIPDEESYVV